MRIPVTCSICDETVNIRGVYEPDTNATVLDDNDSRWDDACVHIQAGGNYELGPFETDEDDFLDSYETTDHGDRAWPY